MDYVHREHQIIYTSERKMKQKNNIREVRSQNWSEIKGGLEFLQCRILTTRALWIEF